MPKYCVHTQVQHFGAVDVRYADSIVEAKTVFAEALYDSRNWRDDEACSCMIYATGGELCECDSNINFHDYPDAMFVIGPRGGIKSEYV